MGAPPTVMTATKIKEFKDAFAMGFTKTEAILYCGVAERTFYDYCSKNPEFTEQIPILQNLPKMKAKMNILKKLNEEDDYNSRWYLEKTDKDFNPKQVIDQTSKNLNYNKDMSDLSDDELQEIISSANK